MQVLVCGRHGQLATALAQQIPAGFDVCFYSSAELNITDAAALESVLADLKPAWLINAAAYTAVDKAESDIGAAFAVNAYGVENLARWCAQHGTRMLHVSTDFVFDGQSTTPYPVDAAPAPLNIYGQSKLAGEQAVLRILPDALVIRCGWLYSAQGQNFVKTMLRLMTERDELNVVNDQRGVPTSVDSLADIVWRCVADGGVRGIQHWADGGSASWYEFALEIARQAYATGLIKDLPRINAIGTAQYPTAAKRPAYSVLANDFLPEYFSLVVRPWQLALGDVLQDIKRKQNA